MVTKAQALKMFIDDRYLGDMPFGFDPKAAACVYDHAYNGGCEIGRHIPDDAAIDWRFTGTVRHLFRVFPAIKVHFEDPDSDFWFNLQLAHDTSATMSLPTSLRDLSALGLQQALFYCCELS